MDITRYIFPGLAILCCTPLLPLTIRQTTDAATYQGVFFLLDLKVDDWHDSLSRSFLIACCTRAHYCYSVIKQVLSTNFLSGFWGKQVRGRTAYAFGEALTTASPLIFKVLQKHCIVHTVGELSRCYTWKLDWNMLSDSLQMQRSFGNRPGQSLVCWWN